MGGLLEVTMLRYAGTNQWNLLLHSVGVSGVDCNHSDLILFELEYPSRDT